MELLNRGAMWDEHDDDKHLMAGCLKLKIEQHPSLKNRLLNTGEKKIIEDCSLRPRESARFWGAVYDQPTGKWIGENVLGVMWMELRAELRRNSKMISRTVGTEKNILEENEPWVDVAPSTPEFIMSTKLTILTNQYHAAEASLAALKEELFVEFLKSTAPANHSTLVPALQGLRVEQPPIKKTKSAGKRGKIGKLPELYYPALSKDTPVSVPDLVKTLNVKNPNAASFLRTQVEKGRLNNTKGKYTLTAEGEAFKATLSGGSAPVATAPAAAKVEKTTKKTKKITDLKGKILKVVGAAGKAGISPAVIAKKVGTTPGSVNVWLSANKKAGGLVKSIGNGKYILATKK